MDDTEDNFWKKPTEIRTFYDYRILGYVDLVCVVIGLLTFIFGIIIITRKHMISPMNTILAHYGGILLLGGICYMPRTYHESFRATLCGIPEHNTYTWEMISWYSLMAAATCRHSAVWLALMMGIWRYIAIIHPLKERRFCNMEVTKKVILLGYVFIFVSTSIPMYFSSGVGPAVKLLDENGCLATNFTTGRNVTIYEFQMPIENYPLLYSLALASLGLFLKLMPSGVLAIISFRLIKGLIDARKRRREMVIISGRKNTYNSRMERQIRQNAERTTIILVIILGLFVLGEVPHGIYSLLTAYYGPKFFWRYWYHAMEVINSLTYFSEMFNFPIYYMMSREIRKTFRAVFLTNCKNRNIVTPPTSSSSLPGTIDQFKKLALGSSATTILSA